MLNAKQIHAKSLPAAGLFLLLMAESLWAQNWKLHAEQNGIKVYTAKQESSALNAIRATFEAEATLSQYAAVILDVSGYKKWNYSSSKAYIISQISDSEFIFYSESKLPWPVSDRYVVLHLKLFLDTAANTLKIVMKDLPEQIPKKEGLVRMTNFSSVLNVVQVTPDKLQVEYVVTLDPGGSIPASVVNWISAKFPIKSFTNLRNLLKSQRD